MFAEDIEKYLKLYFVYTLKQQFIRFTLFFYHGGGTNMDWKKLGFGASLVSIVASIAIYFAHDENLGIFVGLWASALILLSERMAEMQASE